ncbi:phage antirepressor KilAC domain-containing protein [Rhodococcus opacus]|uniref:phage antirepressor KilAC domain-containing protein n=1 Tax=Rhodococcus opacus TaxID=37919 RepID=UPI0034D277C6
MSEIQATAHGDQSPFETLREVRPDGSEFWDARRLMPPMGYASWERFQTAIERAKIAAENSGMSVDGNFRGTAKVSGQRGPAQANYELSRYAAYLVALNGDPRKRETAAAQSYFVIRTREAETAAPALTGPELMATALLEAAATLKAKDQQIAVLEAPARAWNNLADAKGNYSVAEAAKILSQDPNISIGRDRLFDFMHSKRWIFRSRNPRGGWEARQEQVDTGRLYERPARPFLNAKSGEYELPAPTLRVTVKGIARLHDLLGGSGQLTLSDAA